MSGSCNSEFTVARYIEAVFQVNTEIASMLCESCRQQYLCLSASILNRRDIRFNQDRVLTDFVGMGRGILVANLN